MYQEKYEYRCVAGPIGIVVKNNKERDTAVQKYEDIINAHAEDGWEFVTIDEFHTTQPPGCFGLIQEVNTKFKMIVFRRPLGR